MFIFILGARGSRPEPQAGGGPPGRGAGQLCSVSTAGGSPWRPCAWEPLSSGEARASGAPFGPLGPCGWLLVASWGSQGKPVTASPSPACRPLLSPDPCSARGEGVGGAAGLPLG